MLAPLLVPWPVHADAAQPPDDPVQLVPASLYPAGSRFVFQADESNQTMDAAWNYDANGESLMHRYRQDVFQRQAGWVEQAFLQHGKNKIAWFLLFDSTYGSFQDGRQGNISAYEDLRIMLTRWWGARLARHQPSWPLPGVTDGATETRIIPKVDTGPFVVTSLWWGKAREIEAMAFATPDLISRTKLLGFLTRQVRYAAQLP